MALVDKERVKQRFTRALQDYDQHAIAQRKINEQLIRILGENTDMYFPHVLEIGCGTGLLTQLLKQELRVKNWVLNDICDTQQSIEKIFCDTPFEFYLTDAEQWDFNHGCYDLIASASVIQWFNSPRLFIEKLQQHLRLKGILLFSVFSPENLKEVKELTGVSLTYPTEEDWRSWLEKNFHLFHLETKEICLSFSSAIEVLKHLKNTGVTGITTRHWTRQTLKVFIENYEKKYTSENGRVSLTYSPIFIGACKKEK